jgi:hypothetical protein
MSTEDDSVTVSFVSFKDSYASHMTAFPLIRRKYSAENADEAMKINHLKTSGYFIYYYIQRSKILRSAHTMCLSVLCGSENKQRLFQCTALTDWFYNRDGVCLLRGTFCQHSVFVLCGSEKKQ